MNDETEKIFQEQLRKLPAEIVEFLASSAWNADADEIGSLYNLSKEDLVVFKREVTLVLAGLVHPDEFRETLEQELGLPETIIEGLVTATEEKIFAPIGPALVGFFENERDEATKSYEASEAEKGKAMQEAKKKAEEKLKGAKERAVAATKEVAQAKASFETAQEAYNNSITGKFHTVAKLTYEEVLERSANGKESAEAVAAAKEAFAAAERSHAVSAVALALKTATETLTRAENAEKAGVKTVAEAEAFLKTVGKEAVDEVESRKSKVESGTQKEEETESSTFSTVPPTPVKAIEIRPVTFPQSVSENVGAKMNVPPKVTPERSSTWKADILPENLPTAENEEVLPLIPPLTPKLERVEKVATPKEESVPIHPFEEKMKRVFTGGQQSMGDLALETPAPAPKVPQPPETPKPYHADPYREAIE